MRCQIFDRDLNVSLESQASIVIARKRIFIKNEIKSTQRALYRNFGASLAEQSWIEPSELENARARKTLKPRDSLVFTD